MDKLEQVLQAVPGKYFDFNVKHFHEKLREVHGIQFSDDRTGGGWPGDQAEEAGSAPKASAATGAARDDAAH